jgi:hypothetical protein
MQDDRCLGRKLYIPGSMEMNSPTARIFARLQEKFAVIHNDYLKAFPLDPDWPIWLINNLGLSKVPRLVTPLVEPQPEPTQVPTIQESGNANGGVQSGENSADVAITREPSYKSLVISPKEQLIDFDFDSYLHENGDESFDVATASPVTNNGPPLPQDYEMQLMILEQQNKKRLMLARQEQDQLSTSQIQPAHTLQQNPQFPCR